MKLKYIKILIVIKINTKIQIIFALLLKLHIYFNVSWFLKDFSFFSPGDGNMASAC